MLLLTEVLIYLSSFQSSLLKKTKNNFGENQILYCIGPTTPKLTTDIGHKTLWYWVRGN